MKPKRRIVVHGTPEEIAAAVSELSAEHRYFVEIIRLDPPSEPNEAVREYIERIANRTPEEIEANRVASIAASPKPRPLPPGKTLADVMCGKWPGDETDEQVLDALEEMS